MIENFADGIDFGKYDGHTIKDILFGWDSPTEEFIKFYFTQCISEVNDLEIYFNWEPGSQPSKLKIHEFKFLINNEIIIEVQTYPRGMPSNQLLFNLNMLFSRNEEYPTKVVLGSVNDMIMKANIEINEFNYKIHSKGYESERIIRQQNEAISFYEKQIEYSSESLEVFKQYLESGISQKFLESYFLRNNMLKQFVLPYLAKALNVSKSEINEAEFTQFIIEEIYKSYNPQYVSIIQRQIKLFKRRFYERYIPQLRLYNLQEINKTQWKYYKESTKPYFKLFADPNYIFWCVKNVEYFFFKEDLLSAMNGMIANVFKGITLHQIGENKYSYRIEIEQRKIFITPDIIEANASKLEKYYNSEEYKEETSDSEGDGGFYWDNYNSGQGSCSICGGYGECLLSDSQGCPRSSF